MVDRKRFSRKELKQPDEFLTTTDKLLAVFKANQGMVLSIIFGIVVVGAMGAFFLKNQQVQAMRMEFILHEMNQVQVRGEGTEVLEKFLNRFNAGPQKKRAKLILADAYFLEKKFNKAIDLYQEVLQVSRVGDLLYDLVRLSLGYSYEQNKDLQKAIEIYKALIDGNGTLPLFNAYFSLARVYEKEKNYNSAILVLREMKNQFKGHALFGQVLGKIQKLKKSA